MAKKKTKDIKEIKEQKEEVVPSKKKTEKKEQVVKVRRKVPRYYDYSSRMMIRVIFIVFLIILGSTILYLGTSMVKKNEVTYKEQSNVDYDVYLKDNDYYDTDFLPKGMEYIANLIDYIDVTFDYSFEASQNLNSEVVYYIEGIVSVYDRDSSERTIYQKNYRLVEPETFTLENDGSLHIQRNLKIDYDFYNDTIKTFKGDYNLSANSDMKLVLYIEGSGESVTEIPITLNSNMTMTIPLTEQTIDVSMDYVPINHSQVVTGRDEVVINNMITVSCGAILYVLSFIGIIELIHFYVKSKGKKSKYEIYLKKILREYDRLIAETKDINPEEDSTVIDVKTFNELLDIRDNLQLPILFFEINKGQKAWFIIKNKKDYYRFVLKAVDMESEK